MTPLRIYVDGVGLWSPQLANFAALRALLDGAPLAPPNARPAPNVLPATERRRAPISVLLAVEAASQAILMSGRDAATLRCVFASAHGDQPITDGMCATLARAPAELSPTRFHNSVHNAPVGYWTIATGCHAPSTAVAARRASFGAGLLEAASQVLADKQPVLLVCSDTAGTGPLRTVNGCTEPFACAMVLAPSASATSTARLELQLTTRQTETALVEPLATWRAGNASAPALGLLVLLATRGAGCCQLAAAIKLGMRIDKEDVA